MSQVALLASERDAARAELTIAREVIDNDTALITGQACQIAALKSTVTEQAVVIRAFMALTSPEPVKSAPNPFRAFRHDPRRIGGPQGLLR
jgi:hypothetical protein